MSFKTGDVVYLKCGSPAMVISDTDTCDCKGRMHEVTWINNGVPYKQWVLPQVLCERLPNWVCPYCLGNESTCDCI